MRKPSQAGICRRPAISVLLQTRNSAIVDNFAMLVAPGGVDYLAHGNLAHVARDNAIDKPSGVLSSNPVFEEWRNINQRRRIANRVVLVFMMRLVGTHRVVARPLAVVLALAQLKCSFVKCSSDRHLVRV